MADRIVVMNEARIQQVADPLTIATKPATELVARFMGDNNLVSGKVTQSENGRVVIEDEHGVRVSIRPAAPARPSASRRSYRSGPRPSRSAKPAGRGRAQLCPVRDRLRRVPRRSHQAAPHRPAASECWRRCPATVTRPSGARRVRRYASPGRRRMSSSSTPDGPSRPRTISKHTRGHRGRRTGGRGRARARARRRARTAEGEGRRWVTFAWALPGFLWLAFYLIAPLVFIVLMSFWTPDSAKGFVRVWTRRTTASCSIPSA